jgi:DNA-packaging protein gp3
MGVTKGGRCSEMSEVGRPLKFSSIEELERLIEDYFDSCYEDLIEYDSEGAIKSSTRVLKRPYTITGLALALDTSRRTLLDYEARNDEFSHTIKKAKLRCENFAEEQLFTSRNTAGVIFNMKNNYGWVDKQDIDQKTEQTFSIKLPGDLSGD